MLTITMRAAGATHGGRRIEVPITMAELFRTVQVHGEQVVMLQPRPGLLLNLAHVETIEEEGEQAAADEAEQADVAACPHGYLRYTCSICTPAFTSVPQYRGKP